MRVGITGADGLIGWHLSCFLKTIPEVVIRRANRLTFENAGLLTSFVRECDVIVHLAGMNRGDEKILAQTNVRLAKLLIEACEESETGNRRIQMVFSSSTQILKATLYGDSKKQCSELFSQWALKTDSLFANLVLPHVFGEGGRPFYNSAVSTFCYQVAHQDKTQLNDSVLELIHAQQACQQILAAIQTEQSGDLNLRGRKINVGEVLEKILAFDRSYRDLIVPEFPTLFDLYLFNTYRSYLFPEHYPVALTPKLDPRGSLVEVEKNRSGGQTFISTTKPGITRGNHFHLKKIERFCVLSGEATIKVRRLYSKEVRSFAVTGTKPQFIDMPTLHTHNITNTGTSDLVTLFWSNDIFDPLYPDTYADSIEVECNA